MGMVPEETFLEKKGERVVPGATILERAVEKGGRMIIEIPEEDPKNKPGFTDCQGAEAMALGAGNKTSSNEELFHGNGTVPPLDHEPPDLNRPLQGSTGPVQDSIPPPGTATMIDEQVADKPDEQKDKESIELLYGWQIVEGHAKTALNLREIATNFLSEGEIKAANDAFRDCEKELAAISHQLLIRQKDRNFFPTDYIGKWQTLVLIMEAACLHPCWDETILDFLRIQTKPDDVVSFLKENKKNDWIIIWHAKKILDVGQTNYFAQMGRKGQVVISFERPLGEDEEEHDGFGHI